MQSRNANARAGHLGGTSIGLADGHAKWFDSEVVLFGGENWSTFGSNSGLLQGVGVCIDPTKTPRP